MSPGIQLTHKPVGPTSFSIVWKYMKTAKEEAAGSSQRPTRVCHGGTLDPFASGLLLILVEPATRLFNFIHGVPKVYEATIRWGSETHTGDLLGQVVQTGDPSGLTVQKLEAALDPFRGWQDQIPPAMSAKWIDGERAYQRAHRGETVELPAVKVYLHDAKWLSHDLPRESRLRITVRGGYYVRSLAQDLGRLLGCRAHLSALHRSAIGPWADPGIENNVEIRGSGILPWASSRVLTDQEIGDLRQQKPIRLGKLVPGEWKLPPGFPDPQSPIRGFHQGRFCFLLTPSKKELHPLITLRGGM